MKYLILIISSIFFVAGLGAQTDSSSTIPENTVFNARKKVALNREAAYFENVIKFEPTMLLRNCVFFGYDRYIKNDFAISVGAGYCYAFDPLLKNNPSNDVIFESEPFTEIISISQILNVKSKYNAGFAAQIAGRGYFERDDYLPGGYAEIGCRFSYHSFSFTPEDFLKSTGYILKNNQTASLGTTAFTASYGYQLHTTGKIKMVHDFVVGVGYRISAINEIIKSDSYYNTTIGSITGQQVVKEGTMYESKVTFGGFMINVGYTIGFGF